MRTTKKALNALWTQEWFVELLIIVAITPAIVEALLSVQRLPLA